MKLTLKEIEAAIPALTKIYNQELPIKIAYRITKLISEFNKELEPLNTSKERLFSKYGGQQETQMVGKSENIEIFNAEMRQLLNEIVNLEEIKITIEELENIKLTPFEVSTIMWLFT